jgi:nitrite reductase (NO-forming)
MKFALISRDRVVKLTVLGTAFVLLAGSAMWQASGRAASAGGEYRIDGRIFGMPAAEVFEEDYDGPPVVGEFVTLAPHLAPLPPGNRTHDVRVDILTMEIEVGDGVRYHAWTFGGTVPGPVLHVREGDRIVFTMKNRSHEEVSITEPGRGTTPFVAQVAASNYQKASPVAVPMHHSIDFHAAMVAPNDKYRNIHPGETIRFEWVANYPGIYTYHCGTAPVLQHLAMGQYGVVVVSPKQGYPTDGQVDRSYVVLQSEFYLKPGENGLHVLDMEAALTKQPNIVAFNGHQTSLIDAPLKASRGDRVRLYMHNIGPSDVASTHVVGTIFDRVYYEGNLANESRGMQTVLLGASNGAVLEFIVPEDGEYILVDHEFADATKGAVGKIVVGTVDPYTSMSH